jgi:hypothetical protein
VPVSAVTPIAAAVVAAAQFARLDKPIEQSRFACNGERYIRNMYGYREKVDQAVPEGMRTVRNYFSGREWVAGSTTIDSPDGAGPGATIEVSGLTAGEAGALLIQSNLSESVEGQKVVPTISLSAVDPADVGKTVKVRLKRGFGGTNVSKSANFVLTANKKRFPLEPITGLPDNQQWRAMVYQGDSGTPATAVRIHDVMVQPLNHKPDERPDEFTDKLLAWHDTTNPCRIENGEVVSDVPTVELPALQVENLMGDKSGANMFYANGSTPPTVTRGVMFQGVLCDRIEFPANSDTGYSGCRADGGFGLAGRFPASPDTHISGAHIHLSRELGEFERLAYYATGQSGFKRAYIRQRSVGWKIVQSRKTGAPVDNAYYPVLYVHDVLSAPLTVHIAKQRAYNIGHLPHNDRLPADTPTFRYVAHEYEAEVSVDGIVTERLGPRLGGLQNLNTKGNDIAAYTNKVNVTVSESSEIAPPESHLKVFKVLEAAATGQHAISESIAVAAGSYIDEVFIRPNGRRYVTIYPQGVANGYVIVDTNDGTVDRTQNTAGVSVEMLDNGWIKARCMDTAAAGNWLSHIYLSNASQSPAPSYQGDITKGVYLAGASLSNGQTAPKGVRLGGAVTEYLGDTFDLTQWVQRGTATVTALSEKSSFGKPVMRVSVAEHNNDIYKPVAGLTAGAKICPVIIARQVSATGILEVVNPSASGSGLWQIDLSKLSGEFELLKPGHDAVTVINAFEVYTNGDCGVHLRTPSGSGSTVEVDMACIGLVNRSYVPMVVPNDTGSALTVPAAVLEQTLSAGLSNDFRIVSEFTLLFGGGEAGNYDRLWSVYADANNFLELIVQPDGHRIYFYSKLGGVEHHTYAGSHTLTYAGGDFFTAEVKKTAANGVDFKLHKNGVLALDIQLPGATAAPSVALTGVRISAEFNGQRHADAIHHRFDITDADGHITNALTLPVAQPGEQSGFDFGKPANDSKVLFSDGSTLVEAVAVLPSSLGGRRSVLRPAISSVRSPVVR